MVVNATIPPSMKIATSKEVDCVGIWLISHIGNNTLRPIIPTELNAVILFIIFHLKDLLIFTKPNGSTFNFDVAITSTKMG